MWKISNGFTNLEESGYFSTLDIVLRLCDGRDQLPSHVSEMGSCFLHLEQREKGCERKDGP